MLTFSGRATFARCQEGYGSTKPVFESHLIRTHKNESYIIELGRSWYLSRHHGGDGA